MTLKYKIQAKGQPGVADAPKKYYAMPAPAKKMNKEEVIDYICSRVRSVNGISMRAALYAIADTITQLTREGYYLDLGELGSFGIHYSSKGCDTPGEIRPTHIKKASYIWRPSQWMKKRLKELSFEAEKKGKMMKG